MYTYEKLSFYLMEFILCAFKINYCRHRTFSEFWHVYVNKF